MSVQDNISIARNHYDSFNRKDFEGGVKFVDENAVLLIVPTNVTLKGPEGFKQYMQSWFTAYPDAKCEIKNIEAGEDFAICEFKGTGTHDGTLSTPDGDIPATGRHVEISFCDVYHIKNGKVTDMTVYYDQASAMKQLGIFPEMKMHA